MPKKRTNTDRANFASISVTADQKKHFKNLLETAEDELWGYLTEFLSSGHKISLRYDETRDAFASYAYPADETSVNYGTGYSTYGSHPVLVMLFTAYKHVVICDGGVWAVDSDFDFE